MKQSVALVVFLWFTLLSLAGYADDVTNCSKASGMAIHCLDATASCANASRGEGTRACTRAIDSRLYSGRDLSYLYFMRGTTYHQKSDHDRAISDYDAALRLNPDLFLAYAYRFAAYFYRDADIGLVKGMNSLLRGRR